MKKNSELEKVFDGVISYLDSHWLELGDKGAHYLIRRDIWLGRKVEREELDFYFGPRENFEEIILKLRSSNWLKKKRSKLDRTRRQLLVGEKLKLLFWEEVLVRENFLRRRWKEDNRSLLVKYKNELEMIMRWLRKERNDLRVLSSYGVNVLMLGMELLAEKESVDYLLDVWQSMESDDWLLAQRKIYFWTHVIIGASKFYVSKIKVETKNELLKTKVKVEDLLKQYWNKLSLDVRLESGLAFELLGKREWVQELILEEAMRNLSKRGNYIYDPRKGNDDLITAEHRTVLFLMLAKKFLLES